MSLLVFFFVFRFIFSFAPFTLLFTCFVTFVNLPYYGLFTFASLKFTTMYKVRVLDNLKLDEHIYNVDSYDEAVERFLFFVHLALENRLSVRCVNIIRGKKVIKLFQNH